MVILLSLGGAEACGINSGDIRNYSTTLSFWRAPIGLNRSRNAIGSLLSGRLSLQFLLKI